MVVGVSDYQHKDIPDLKYAHKDAEAFSAWLKSSAGGNVKDDNITLLTNSKATNAAVGTAIYSMLDVCKPNDQFIFYFSGHGDVESKTRAQPGYLLTYDSPANVYMVGALNLRDLQEIIATLSESQVKVLLCTDACHAGKLAGTSINGTQATAASISKQFANEVKIMSCQPNEFSLEGEQWGKGRGVFSWHLIDGLTGLADKSANGEVSLMEINRYLQDIVPSETAPHSQIPFVVGNLQQTISFVDNTTLLALKKEKATGEVMISTIVSKGLEEEILAQADEKTKKLYNDFKKSLENGDLLYPKGECSDDYYEQLLKVSTLYPILGMMKRNFAVALLNEVQQAINALLDNDPYEANTWRYSPSKYKEYPIYLEKAMSLLGEKHYMYKSLSSKKLYFEGYNLYNNSQLEAAEEPRNALKQKAKEKYLAALALEPNAAYINYAIEVMYIYNNPLQSDSVFRYGNRAIELSPTWSAPYLDLCWELTNLNDLPKVEEYLQAIS